MNQWKTPLFCTEVPVRKSTMIPRCPVWATLTDCHGCRDNCSRLISLRRLPKCHAFDRNWPVWQKEVERFEITADTILVGHSTGAGFIVKYLSTHSELKVGKVVLVAPWLDPDREHTKNFFDDFEIDPNLVLRTKGISVFLLRWRWTQCAENCWNLASINFGSQVQPVPQLRSFLYGRYENYRVSRASSRNNWPIAWYTQNNLLSSLSHYSNNNMTPSPALKVEKMIFFPFVPSYRLFERVNQSGPSSAK